MESMNLQDEVIENITHNYINELFAEYANRKGEHRLYESSPKVPKIIITTYYTYVTPEFSKTNFHNFKKRYIYNENKLEAVHSKEEQMGLRKVYDYIEGIDSFDDINIYTISSIHELLYSLTPYPEYGGKYRRSEACLLESTVELTPPMFIVYEMNLLKEDVDALVKEGLQLGRENNPQAIMAYIDKCIELKSKLIKIHPFPDGNGRSIRAFINLLFRLANIPPVYIENREKDKYREALETAIVDGDFTKIKTFYYYKICDSILSLDVNLSQLINSEELKRTRKP